MFASLDHQPSFSSNRWCRPSADLFGNATTFKLDVRSWNETFGTFAKAGRFSLWCWYGVTRLVNPLSCFFLQSFFSQMNHVFFPNEPHTDSMLAMLPLKKNRFVKTYKLLALHHVQQSSKRYPMKPKVHVLRLELLSLGRRGATCVVSSYYQRKFSGKLPIYELLGSLGMYHDMSEVFMEILLDMKVYLESCRVLVRLMILRLFQLSLFVGKEFNLCWKIEDRSEEQTTAMLTRTSWDSARNWHGKYIDTSHLIKYLVVLCLSLLLFFFMLEYFGDSYTSIWSNGSVTEEGHWSCEWCYAGFWG